MTKNIKSEAIAAYPNEAVWVVTDKGTRQVTNIAERPQETFNIAKRNLLAARNEGLRSIIHSHPDYPACPSAADMRSQIDMGIPWGIVATDGTDATEIAWWGGEREPLDDRGFRHGITDCYSLIRDWYAIEWGITLKEFPRDWEWWLHDGDLYRDGFKAAGFRHIDHSEAQPGDVWLAQLRSPVPNHAGVLLEHGLTIHHPSARWPVDLNQRSRREPINRWQQHITHILRYENDISA